MTGAASILLQDARDTLLGEVLTDGERRDVDVALASWLLRETAPGLPLPAVVEAAAERVAGQRTYRDVAVLGYAAAAGRLPTEYGARLVEGMRWLAARSPLIDGQPAAFCCDAVGLLGVTLGGQTLGADVQQAVSAWLERFIGSSYTALRRNDCARCLLVAVESQAGILPSLGLPDLAECVDVRVALRERGVLPQTDRDASDDEARQVLLQMKAGVADKLGVVRAALRLAAYESIVQREALFDLKRPTVNDVANLLRLFPHALRRWTWEDAPRTSRQGAEARRWHVDNEYHVQNLLWFLLAPYFRDLRCEEYIRQIGQTQPRADLGIPSLHLIIEVKFLRSHASFRSVIEEVAADASLYFIAGSLYRQAIAFIWDDSRRTEQHTTLIDGLRQLERVADVIVVPKPGTWG